MAAARAAADEARSQLEKVAREKSDLESKLLQLTETQEASAKKWRMTEESLQRKIEQFTAELNDLRNARNGSAAWL